MFLRDLSKEKHTTLNDSVINKKAFKKNKDLVIKKPNKGDTVVIPNIKGYISKMKTILKDRSKFRKLSIDENKVLSLFFHIERRIIDVLRKTETTKTVTTYVQ